MIRQPAHCWISHGAWGPQLQAAARYESAGSNAELRCWLEPHEREKSTFIASIKSPKVAAKPPLVAFDARVSGYDPKVLRLE